MSKEQLAAHLAALRESYNGPTTLYAPSRKPDRAPHRKKPSLIDEAFEQVLQDGRALMAARA